jgi:hypothetical protein
MTIEEAFKELEKAQAKFKEAQEIESEVRKEVTAALNRLNEAQKKFDSVVAAIKLSATGGDWKDAFKGGR